MLYLDSLRVIECIKSSSNNSFIEKKITVVSYNDAIDGSHAGPRKWSAVSR